LRKVNQFAGYFKHVAHKPKRIRKMNIIYSRIESTESTNLLAMANATNALENSIYVFSAAFQTAGRDKAITVGKPALAKIFLRAFW
jgi:hypothetical protein